MVKGKPRSSAEKKMPPRGEFHKIKRERVRELLGKLGPNEMRVVRENLRTKIVKEMIYEGYRGVERVVLHPSQIVDWTEEYKRLKKLKATLPDSLQGLTITEVEYYAPVFEDDKFFEMKRAGVITPETVVDEGLTPVTLSRRWEDWKIQSYREKLERNGITIPEDIKSLDIIEANWKKSISGSFKYLVNNNIIEEQELWYYTQAEMDYMVDFSKKTGTTDAPMIMFERKMSEETPDLDPVEYAVFKAGRYPAEIPSAETLANPLEDPAENFKKLDEADGEKVKVLTTGEIITMILTSMTRKMLIDIVELKDDEFHVHVINPEDVATGKKLSTNDPKFMCLNCEAISRTKKGLNDGQGNCVQCGMKLEVMEIKPVYYEARMLELSRDGIIDEKDIDEVLDLIAREVQRRVWKSDWNEVEEKHEKIVKDSMEKLEKSESAPVYYYNSYYYHPYHGYYYPYYYWGWYWHNPRHYYYYNNIYSRHSGAGTWRTPPSLQRLAQRLGTNMKEFGQGMTSAFKSIGNRIARGFSDFGKQITQRVKSCVTHDACHSACHSNCHSNCHSACHSNCHSACHSACVSCACACACAGGGW
ncbi:MAG: hypothetical protein ACTSU5_06480 [Promethearchaeota archaeon]